MHVYVLYSMQHAAVMLFSCFRHKSGWKWLSFDRLNSLTQDILCAASKNLLRVKSPLFHIKDNSGLCERKMEFISLSHEFAGPWDSLFTAIPLEYRQQQQSLVLHKANPENIEAPEGLIHWYQWPVGQNSHTYLERYIDIFYLCAPCISVHLASLAYFNSPGNTTFSLTCNPVFQLSWTPCYRAGVMARHFLQPIAPGWISA